MAVGPTVAHRLQYAFLRSLEEVVARLSWAQRVRVGATLGRVWHRVDGTHRRIATENVRRAFPDWRDEEIRRLVKANFENLGKTAVESLGLSHTTSAELLARCRFEGLEHLEAALSEGQGVLALSGHLGNWELGGLAMAALGTPFYAVGRRQSNPLVDRRVAGLRETFGGTLIHHRNAVRPVLRALREGAMVAFLMDQRARGREAVPSRFFDQPVATNQGLALLALKSRAPVVPGFDERVDDGHVIRFQPQLPRPQDGSRDDQVRWFTERFDAAIEDEVRRRPEQWFWVHRRWRLPEEWAQ